MARRRKGRFARVKIQSQQHAVRLIWVEPGFPGAPTANSRLCRTRAARCHLERPLSVVWNVSAAQASCFRPAESWDLWREGRDRETTIDCFVVAGLNARRRLHGRARQRLRKLPRLRQPILSGAVFHRRTNAHPPQPFWRSQYERNEGSPFASRSLRLETPHDRKNGSAVACGPDSTAADSRKVCCGALSKRLRAAAIELSSHHQLSFLDVGDRTKDRRVEVVKDASIGQTPR